ncbi:MAG: hypothetical protein LBF93_12750 [Zoogloeaceae bacterium]|jgi:hypothetical protein|nr:hypothetical protein [Zoogloeaceae bacterium]
MPVMPTEFDALLRSPALLKAALDFNGLAAPDCATPELRFLAQNPRVRRFLRPPMPETAVWCFEPKPNRLALLPLPFLARLLSYWSAAVWAEDLARIIEKNRLLPILEWLGPDVYRYAARRGRFQLGGLRAGFRRGEDGENPADARNRAEMENWLTDVFPRPGNEMFALCLARWPQPLRAAWEKRWQRALPQAGRDAAAFSSFPAAWRWLEKMLTSEVAPEWQPCFNS